jgi:Amt family ammonium transporter
MKTISIRQAAPFLLLVLIAGASLFISPETMFDGDGKYNSSDIAWVLISAALVFLMTPGLAFFYGGMVNSKNVISTMIKSIVSAGVVSVLWVVVVFSLCFGESIGGVIGNPSTYFFFQNVVSGKPWDGAPTIPFAEFAFFHVMFAIITPGIVVGAVAERIKFTSYTLFIVLFSLFVYAPLAHWSWHPEGFLAKLGVLDFAGGTVVHISAGCAALAGVLVLKRRRSHLFHIKIRPANITYVLIGTGLLWFGWFGFNAGSALAASGLAVSAFATTNTAAAAAGLAWMFFDVLRGKKPSVLGFCIGAVVGLVAITPGAGFVAIPQSIFIGVVAAIISNLAVEWKSRSSLDDTLDVIPCHGVGGVVGMILTGIFANSAVNGVGADGLFYGGTAFFLAQLIGVVVVVTYSFTISYGIFKLVDYIDPLRVSEEEEEQGLDITQHDEELYSYSEIDRIVIEQKVKLKMDKERVTTF